MTKIIPSDTVNVVYIAGAGRSGSTILERVLAKAEDTVEVGELRYFWTRGLLENLLCGCNERFHSCDFWKTVLRDAFPGKSSDEIAAKVNPYTDLLSFQTLFKGYTTKDCNRMANFCQSFIFPLYSSISAITSGKMILDSSKNPGYLYLLQKCGNINLKVIHLVRDSRAVVYSWKKRKLRPEISGKKVFMPRLSTQRSASLWLVFNIAIELLKNKPNTKYVRVLYEDFVADPIATIQGLLDFLGVKDNITKFVLNRDVFLETAHSVSGNPMRFEKGKVKLIPDDSWRDEMNAFDRLVASFITWPLLSYYY